MTLWDRAYDDLKIEDPELVKNYEELLVKELQASTYIFHCQVALAALRNLVAKAFVVCPANTKQNLSQQTRIYNLFMSRM